MTIPQQECREKRIPECRIVTKEECEMVPQEKCRKVQENYQSPGRCRKSSRIQCEDKPRQKCGKKVQSSNNLLLAKPLLNSIQPQLQMGLL